MDASLNTIVSEALESRRLFAAFPTLNSAGTLTFVGTNAAETVEVKFTSPTRVVTTVNGFDFTSNRARVKRIFISGQGGDDVIRNSTNLPSTLTGNGGNDKLYGGQGNDSLNGGSGNDLLEGRAGNDHLTGGSGRDAMFGGSGMDVFDALDGEPDYLDGGPEEDAVNLDLSDTFVNI